MNDLVLNNELTQLLQQNRDLINPLLTGRLSFRQKLIEAHESGQPLPIVRLSNQTILNNVVVTEVGTDSVVFTDVVNDHVSSVQLKDVVSFGTL